MAYYYPPLQAAIWQDAFGQDWRPEYPKDDWSMPDHVLPLCQNHLIRRLGYTYMPEYESLINFTSAVKCVPG
jgi:hypothetical protein